MFLKKLNKTKRTAMTNTTTHTACVFIVDDDEQVRNALTLLMESIGLQAASFASAQEYLDQFDAERPGCLILDVRMPGISGLDLQARLSAEMIHPPIIIITGHGDVLWQSGQSLPVLLILLKNPLITSPCWIMSIVLSVWMQNKGGNLYAYMK